MQKKTTLKKRTGKDQAEMVYIDLKIDFIPRQTMNKCIQKTTILAWMTKGKTLVQKDPTAQRTRPKQLSTHYVPTNDVEIWTMTWIGLL